MAKRGKRIRGDELFPIVGIGASAGGLEALEGFLRHVPVASGMAFVVVQHLDPTHECVLAELLQRATLMPVEVIRDGAKVQRDRVYVIPPNTDLAILHGVLRLLEPAGARGLRLPIDFFFRSLAEDRHEHAVGVILSGMGSDGTLGLRSIKEKAGVVFVQDPNSAKFSGMPRSAIEARLADVVAPVEELPERILAYIRHGPLIQPEATRESAVQSDLDKILILIRLQTGHDFTLYKPTTLRRRLERRMGIHQIDKMSGYVRFLQENPQEGEMLFHELLIGVTSFFRDPEAWSRLKEVMQSSFWEGEAAVKRSTVVRAWTAGCSTGEEAYSLAMLFKEAQAEGVQAKNLTLQIFATDLDGGAIEKARGGLYPCNIAADVSQERLDRFFVEEGEGFRIRREIRDMVTFATQNLVMDPPFTKLDLLICRNLLIYLAPELQKKVLPLFHYCLNPQGILFLGSAETVGSHTELFCAIEAKMRIYRRLESPRRFPVPAFPLAAPLANSDLDSPAPDLKGRLPNLQQVAEQLLLQSYAPPALLTTARGDILYVMGRTGKYLEPAAGKVNWNVFAMARPGLRTQLTQTFHRALKENKSLEAKGISLESEGRTRCVNLVVQPLQQPEALRGMTLIVFRDVEVGREGGQDSNTDAPENGASSMEEELHRSREELQTLREEMQSADEELRSNNEELQSTNEEMQSTNEELTTSKEEMQSLNEELHSLNQELQARVSDLSAASNDMKNLLDNTEMAIVFLDDALRLRRFTPLATRVIKLIPGDVGRPITDVTSRLDYPQLADDAREVLRTLVCSEKQVSAGNDCFTVRIMPYRTLGNRIDGLVITFVDATATRLMESSLRSSEARLRDISESPDCGATLCDSQGEVILANPAAQALLGQTQEQIQRRRLFEPALRLDGSDLPASENPVALALETGLRVNVTLGLHHSPNPQVHWLHVEAQTYPCGDSSVGVLVTLREAGRGEPP